MSRPVLVADVDDAQRTLRSVLEKVEQLIKIPLADLPEYQRDLDTIDSALRGLVRHHRRVNRDRVSG